MKIYFSVKISLISFPICLFSPSPRTVQPQFQITVLSQSADESVVTGLMDGRPMWVLEGPEPRDGIRFEGTSYSSPLSSFSSRSRRPSHNLTFILLQTHIKRPGLQHNCNPSSLKFCFLTDKKVETSNVKRRTSFFNGSISSEN